MTNNHVHRMNARVEIAEVPQAKSVRADVIKQKPIRRVPYILEGDSMSRRTRKSKIMQAQKGSSVWRGKMINQCLLCARVYATHHRPPHLPGGGVPPLSRLLFNPLHCASCCPLTYVLPPLPTGLAFPLTADGMRGTAAGWCIPFIYLLLISSLHLFVHCLSVEEP